MELAEYTNTDKTLHNCVGRQSVNVCTIVLKKIINLFLTG